MDDREYINGPDGSAEPFNPTPTPQQWSIAWGIANEQQQMTTIDRGLLAHNIAHQCARQRKLGEYDLRSRQGSGMTTLVCVTRKLLDVSRVFRTEDGDTKLTLSFDKENADGVTVVTVNREHDGLVTNLLNRTRKAEDLHGALFSALANEPQDGGSFEPPPPATAKDLVEPRTRPIKQEHQAWSPIRAVETDGCDPIEAAPPRKGPKRYTIGGEG